MPVVGSEGQPAVPAQLSVRRGRAASEFYKAAFGAEEIYRLGGTDAREDAVRRAGCARERRFGGGRVPVEDSERHRRLDRRLLPAIEQPTTSSAGRHAGRDRGRRWPRRDRLEQRRPAVVAGSSDAWPWRRAYGRKAREQINRSVPPPTVVPVLIYPDVRPAVAFLAGAFGFVERTRIGASHRAQLPSATTGP